MKSAVSMTLNIYKMKALLILPLLASTAFSSAAVTYNFTNSGNFDGDGNGESWEVADSVDPSVLVTLTTVDILGYQGAGTSLASEGGSHTTNVNNGNTLGVNSQDDPGVSGENSNFNPGEAWIISFNSSIQFNDIDFSGWNGSDGGEITISAAGITDIVIGGNDIDDSDDTYSFTAPETIAANTPVTIAMTNITGEDGIRISNFTVTAIPEPSSLLLVLLGSSAFGLCRKRHT
ncbi:PEP-CTERM sorting domain-containing protein [Roseibacillus persicicus]|uniref:Ice-binding protein C-terminal domain-containing protein n=2 Tax=Roseibacillus persicicus TaxID=454148 RepID=A0A918TDR6_9BACT|nr:hypothetical protein GCM10007100_02040 [Roseibacillus persicicus]